MENCQPKKLLLLRVLEILTEYSDEAHKLRQNEIINLLKTVYGFECERKAIARNIEFLQQAGYDIVSDKNGSYLATRRYERGELRLLIDSVLANRYIGKKHTRDLINKLTEEGGKHFTAHAKHVVNLDSWQKENNPNYFYNVELLCEAIDKKVKVEFNYTAYGKDKRLCKKHAQSQKVNPYRLIMKNARYYLICNYDQYDNMLFCRVDKIADLTLTNEIIKPLTSIDGYGEGINLGKLSNSLPYLYDDEPQLIELLVEEDMIDTIIDWFGFDITIKEAQNGKVMIYLYASEKAMRFWVLQYGKFVKVLTPPTLADTIKDDLTQALKLYE